MRDTPVSNCERDFVLSVIEEKKRIDGRQPTDNRQIQVSFRGDFGGCDARLGKTRVLAQVSAEVAVPKVQRPNEGTLFINVELSPMAHPSFEQGRQTDETVELSRLLERGLKESKCVDLESLCIVVGEKVWSLRVDVTVLNQEGNMLDCACLAAIAALAHFRRPDVTVQGQDITIHSPEERDPLPLSILHIPLTVTFSFYHQGKNLVVDPSLLEERCAEGRMSVGMNHHRELCLLHVTGQMLLHRSKVEQCSKIAFVKVLEMTELIREALANDKAARARGERWGCTVSSGQKKIHILSKEAEVVPTPIEDAGNDSDAVPSDSDSDDDMAPAAQERCGRERPKVMGDGVAILGRSAVKRWEDDAMDQDKGREGEARGSSSSPVKMSGKKSAT